MNNRAEVVTAGKQRGALVLVHDIDGFSAYAQRYFTRSRFIDDVESHAFARESAGNPYSPNHFRCLTLTSMLAAQFGFDSLEGNNFRRRTYQWRKYADSPEHQIATAIYMAKANKQALRIKDDLLAAYPIGANLQPGIWGSNLPFINGRVGLWPEYSGWSRTRVRGIAEGRIQYTHPISLPDRELIEGLAELNFTNDDAESMSQEKFFQEVFPAVQTVVNRLMSPQVVFATG